MSRTTGSYNNSNNHRHHHPLPQPTPHPNARIYVGDLAYFCNETHLHSTFSQYGAVQAIQLMRNPSGQTQMHAYVDMRTEEEARHAASALEGVKVLGRRIRY
ncbi:RNA-binding protein [archaeon]|nr:MAG: RNA-binding protein [archaeon]